MRRVSYEEEDDSWIGVEFGYVGAGIFPKYPNTPKDFNGLVKGVH
jgi:hypothetical protein